jgi:hypothetical protein
MEAAEDRLVNRERTRVHFALGLDAKMTHVNDSPVNDDATTGLGGPRTIEEFTIERWVSVPRSWPDRPS